MAATLTLIVGPAHSGKTSRLLGDYRRAIAAGPVGAALWLAPSGRAVAELRERLTSPELSACLDPQCLTFGRFASRVLAASRQAIRPLDRLGQRAILRNLTLGALAAGELRHFAPIAETPGFLDLLVRFIRELKRLEIWPEHFAGAALRGEPAGNAARQSESESQSHRSQGHGALTHSARRFAGGKMSELAAIYASYQDLLVRHQLYDAEGRFWSARELLRSGPSRPFERLREVYVDGFSDFTRTEHEILELLAGRVERIVISLTDEPAPRREELFAKTAKTRDELARRHPRLAVEQVARRAGGDWPALEHLAANVFRQPHDAPAAPPLERIELHAAPSARGEITLIAARIKRLLTLGEPPLAERPVRPGEILVVFRSLEGVADLARELFAEFGIPAAIEADQPLGRSGLLSALTGLIRVAREDWSYHALLAALSNTYLRPAWKEARPRAARQQAANLVRGLQVSRGQKKLLAEAERSVDRARRATAADVAGMAAADAGAAVPAETDSAAGAGERALQRASTGQAFLERLATSLAILPSRATAAAWLDALERLALDTGVLPSSAPDSDPDAIAWAAAKRLLADAARLDDWLGQPQRELDFPAFWTLWQDILHFPAPGMRDEAGRVRILSAPSARGLSAPYVFLADLGEQSFPQPGGERSLLSDSELDRLIEAGLPLASRTDRGRDEMLLFYETITRPTRALLLSYAALDAKAQPLVPSPYLYDLQQICGERWLSATATLDLSPIPNRPAPLSPQDLRLMAVARAAEPGERRLFAALLQDGSLGANLTRGLQAIAQRQSRDGFGAYEGLLVGEAAQGKLAARYGPETPWSASQLDEYLVCPYEFFLRRILQIEPLAELELSADPLARGTLLHETLAAFHRQHNEHSGGPALLGDGSEEATLAAALNLLDAACARRGGATAIGEALREIDRRWLRKSLARYLVQQQTHEGKLAKQNDDLRPAHFEVAFGRSLQAAAHDERAGEAPADPLSTAEPFRFDCGGETVLIRGQIDRVDLGMCGDSLVFNVVDYKSGGRGGLSAKAVENGQALQLPLYVLAVAELLLARQAATPRQAGYWFLKESGYQAVLTCHEAAAGGLQSTAKWTALRERLAQRVLAAVEGARRGQFPVFSADEHCTSRCDYRTVCRVHQVRSLDKIWPPEADPPSRSAREPRA